MRFNNYKLLGKKETSTSLKAFKFYRSKAKYRDKKRVYDRQRYATLLNSIYEKVRYAAINNEGGVYAPGFFYIIPQPYPKKNFIRLPQKGGTFKGTMNLHTKGLIYSIFFVNLLRDSKHKLWDMTNSYTQNIREMLVEKLKSYEASYLFSLDTLTKAI